MNLLDTSYLVDYERGREPARAFFRQHEHEPLAVSTISFFELAFGIVRDDPEALDSLRPSLQWAELLAFTPDDAIEAAMVQSELQLAGDRIPVADVLIAGVARNRGAALVTRDDHFSAVDGLETVPYPA